MSLSFFGSSFTPLAQAMHVRAFRQEVLAGNIANADTPGYRARDLSFHQALVSELDGGGDTLALRRTNSRQFPVTSGDPLAAFVEYRTGGAMGIDGNNVDLSGEESQFTSNALDYEADLAFLTQRIKQLQLAIKGN